MAEIKDETLAELLRWCEEILRVAPTFLTDFPYVSLELERAIEAVKWELASK